MSLLSLLKFLISISGLFAGFSFLTFLELFFYFVFQPIVRRVKRSKVSPIEDTIVQLQDHKSKALRGISGGLKYFYHYMEESSLHGLNHASFKNLVAIERIFWLIAFAIFLIVFGFLIGEMFGKYQNAPVIVSFDGDFKSVNTVKPRHILRF
jgi:hypothetical protein